MSERSANVENRRGRHHAAAPVFYSQRTKISYDMLPFQYTLPSYGREGVPMSRHRKEIRAIVVPPKSECTKQQFQKKMCDFYISQVERRLQSLPKERKLEVIDALLASTYQ